MPVVVAPNVLGPRSEWSEGWETDPVIMVISEDVAGAADALRAAAARFSTIDEYGRELEDWEVFQGESYTPNYVSEVQLSSEGLLLWADTKGELPFAMGHKMIKVVVDELASRGLSAAVGYPSQGLEGARPYEFPMDDSAQSPPPVESEEPARTWYIARSVGLNTTDGRKYQDCEFWSPTSGWSLDRGLATTYDESPKELVDAHRTEERPASVVQPTAIYLSADEDPWPMPPRALRR